MEREKIEEFFNEAICLAKTFGHERIAETIIALRDMTNRELLQREKQLNDAITVLGKSVLTIGAVAGLKPCYVEVSKTNDSSLVADCVGSKCTYGHSEWVNCPWGFRWACQEEG